MTTDDKVVMHYKHALPSGVDIMLRAVFNHDGSECYDFTGHTGVRPLTEAELASIVTPEVVIAMVRENTGDKMKNQMRGLRLVK